LVCYLYAGTKRNKEWKMNKMLVAAATVFVTFGAASFAGTGTGPEVVPVPNPAASEAPAKACVKKQSAVIFNVADEVPCKDACGRCASKWVTVAQVYASPNTCENCGTIAKVREMRCERGACGACDEKSVQENIQALASTSRRVRLAGQRSLRLCDFRVSHKRDCVTEAIPTIVLY